MTPTNTKPAKADASAVEVLEDVRLCAAEFAHAADCYGMARAIDQCLIRGQSVDDAKFVYDREKVALGEAFDALAAALQSSSSAEAELRALLTSAKATIALLMADKVDLQARVKVLEEALLAIRAKMREDVEIADEEDGPCLVPLDDDIVLRDIDNLLSTALNHGKGEDARAAVTKDQGGEHGE